MNFVNAYNFVPVLKEHAPSYAEQDMHTGLIEYSITTRSPLFIPNTTSLHAFPGYKSVDPTKDHKSFDFFSYNILQEGENYKNQTFEPVIPGSELRGMFRSIYETLTNSCMGVLNDDLVPVKRTLEVFKAGLIEKSKDGKYALWTAEDVIFHVPDEEKSQRAGRPIYKKIFDDESAYPYDKYDEGTLLYFQKNDREKGKPDTNSVSLPEELADNREGFNEGYLIRGESDNSFGKKTNCHLFIKDSHKQDLTADNLKSLEDVLESYQNQPKQNERYSRYEKAFKSFKKASGPAFFPVYYSSIEKNKKKILYLSPAAITKERANRNIGDIITGITPCRNKESMCPACSLFGMIGVNNEEAVASKIRFTDALLDKAFNRENCYDSIVTLQTLATPKVSNSEFYLKKQEQGDVFWTYDYRTDGTNIFLDEAKIRGRKFYWHQPDKKLPAEVERSDLNKTVRPVKSGVTFHGKLYYDRVSQKQLEQLIWILNGGCEEDQVGKGEIAYKLGGGKPLGLGSVLCKVTAVTERVVSLENENIQYKMNYNDIAIKKYREVDGFIQDGKDSSGEKIRESFLIIHSLNAITDRPVTYPVTESQLQDIKSGRPLTEGYKWFTENHPNWTKLYSRNSMRISETLPTIEEESPIDRQALMIGKVEKLQECRATVNKIDGKNIGFKLEIGNDIVYTNLKMGGSGLESINRKNCKELLPVGTKVILKKGGIEDGKVIWAFLRKADEENM